ncbi:unnamed protein product [Rotaria socialis]|uniref:Uncharacterized protein n=1 Tax=Rotaria socialis TaxID=392032 RepID=A0A820T439_9BILA|nr:unnamed protein product [Rotaria socialis]CAF4464923.1 unnamed protein product [Rotaria socialis]
MLARQGAKRLLDAKSQQLFYIDITFADLITVAPIVYRPIELIMAEKTVATLLSKTLEQIPKYSGKPDQDADEWMKDLTDTFHMTNITESQALKIISTFLEGHSKQWFIENITIFEFWNYSRQHFIKPIEQRHVIIQNIQKSNPPLIFANTLVNGSRIHRMIDAEVTHSFITQRVLSTLYHSTIPSCDRIVQLGDGQTILKIVGEVQLLLQFDKIFTLLNVLVVKTMNTDFILGSDWCTSNAARIYYEKKTNDVLIFSLNFNEHKKKHLIEILSILSKANFQVNPDNCSIAVYEIDFLSHTINKQFIKSDGIKITAIIAFPAPTTFKEANELVSQINWYRKFIPNFARIAVPLHEVTNKTKHSRHEFKWGPGQHHSFDEFKRILTTYPLFLEYPDLLTPFILTMNAIMSGNICHAIIVFSLFLSVSFYPVYNHSTLLLVSILFK